MADPLKFPTSPEIKRVLSAVRAAGIIVSFVEIEPSRLRIFASHEWEASSPDETAFDRWKVNQSPQ
jgi:hypothetical protein